MNSENVGPYGDAINHELIPYLETAVSRDRHRGGRAGCSADRPAAGKRSRRRSSIPTTTTARGPRVPTPSTSGCTSHQHLRREERVLQQRRLEEDAARRRPRLLRSPDVGHRRGRALGARPRHARPLRRSVEHLASGVQPRRRRRLPEVHLGSDDGRHRPPGRRVLARSLRPCATSSSATGRRSARSSPARSTSTSARWIRGI